MSLLRSRRSRRRGFALADFLAGSLIFAGTMTVFTSLTRSKFEMLGTTDLRTRALADVEVQVDLIRSEGLKRLPQGKADRDGFRKVAPFTLADRLPGGEGVIELRALRMDDGQAHQLYEARVTVTWREYHGRGRLSMSTVVALPERGPR